MKQDLIQKTQEWMQLERKTVEQRKEAENFYENQLMNLIVDEYIKRNKQRVAEHISYLIVSVGTSYEPIVLNISLFKPDRVLFLYTDTSEKTLDKIVGLCHLAVSQYEKRRVSGTDPLDIYQEIKAAYLQWNRPEKLYIDFTGGTKTMSAACALAGSMIDVQLVYVGTEDYLVDFRKPRPGTETLFYITNPLVVFGDLEIEKAMGLFSEYNFAGAREKLDILKESIPNPEIRQQLHFAWLLAKSYESWDSLDFIPAYENINKLLFQLKRDCMHTDYLLMDCTDRLRQQQELLEGVRKIPGMILNRKNMDILQDKNIIVSLMFTMYQNAITREKQEKYDTATLLYYRLLEMIEQRRLSKYNLFVSAMDYKKMKINVKCLPKYEGRSESERIEILKTDVSKIKKGLFGKAGNGYLPDQVSLLDGFIILYALQDAIIFQSQDDQLAILKRMRAMVFLRNNSIFAHGLGPVRKADFEKFRGFVVELFIGFCKIEKVDYEKYLQITTLVDPTKSCNYASLRKE